MYKRKKKRKEKHKKKKKKKKIFALAFFLKLLPSLAFGERFSDKTDLPHSLPQNSSLLNLFYRNQFVIVEGKDEKDKTLISCKL